MERSIRWERELKGALQRAELENRNILLFFHNPN